MRRHEPEPFLSSGGDATCVCVIHAMIEGLVLQRI
jgi:hypothetical protein